MCKCFKIKKSRLKITILLGMVMWLLGGSLFAQPDTLWTRTYGGTDWDGGYSVCKTQDGGYIIAGWTDSFGAGGEDVYLVKTDANGNTLWTKTYGGIGDDRSYSVYETQDGGYIIVGWTASFDADLVDAWLLKTDVNGDTLWTKTFKHTRWDEGRSVQQTKDDGYIIAGYTESFGPRKSDVWLVKTDVNGNILWTRTYGGTGWEWGESVQQTQDGGYVIAGWTESFGARKADVYLVKTDANGNTLWTKTYGGTDWDFGYSVCKTQDGGYIIVGETKPKLSGEGNSDIYLVKTDANGDTLWTRRYGGTLDDWGYSVCEIQDGGYIIAGGTESYGAGEGDVWLIKTDKNGNILWTKTYGGTGDDGGYSVQQTPDGGYIIAGWTESFGAGKTDVWLIKTKPDVVGIEEGDKRLEVGALKAYPNPFTQKTVIRSLLSGSSQKPAQIKIYDRTGRLVKTLESVSKKGGYSIEWDGTDNNNKKVAPGVYFVRLLVDKSIATKKLIKLR